MNSKYLSPTLYREFLRNDLDSFIERSFYELNPGTEFIQGKYIGLLAATLEKVRLGEIKRLIVNLPPRTLKSHAVSVAFSAWLLGHKPSTQIICASYGQDLADKHGRDSRTWMESAAYRDLFPDTVLSPTKMSVNDFMTTAQGCRMATSVGGVLTGRGAEFLIVDDPLKPEDALSEPRRSAANDWYFSTLLSRLNNKKDGAIIIVMQRLHQQDLVGEVTDREPWEVLSLPAIAKEDEVYKYRSLFGPDVFTRKAGEALHPERDSVATYLRIRESIGEYNYQSQYQQSPTTREGGLVKREWLRFYDPGDMPKDYEWTLQSWDTAYKTGGNNDFSVCTTWKLIGADFYLVDVFRRRLTYPELKRAAVELYGIHQPFTVLIEDQASGTSLIQELKSAGLPIEPYRPPAGSNKSDRFAAQSIKFENGRVYVPEKAPWLNEYIQEITGFPGAKHDDQVDSTSQALETLTPKAGGEAFWRGLNRFNCSRQPRESW
jgi:predicted phage terminase large subunit-like protein